MNNWDKIRQGLQVYGPDNRVIGTVDRVEGNNFYVNGHTVPANMISRVDNNGVWLSGTNYGTGQNQKDIRIPIVEERLNVGKKQTDLGEVQVHKSVTQEQQNVPVDLRREEVYVEQRDVPDRRLNPDEANRAFQEGTIRVPVRGEEAVVNKEAVVTDEVGLHKTARTERQNVSDTVRKEHVEMGGDYAQGQQPTTRDTRYNTTDRTAGYAAQQSTTGQTRSQANRDPNYAAGTSDRSGQLQPGTDVYGSDSDLVGQIKEVNSNNLLVDRKMQRDVYVPISAIQNITNDGVTLNIGASDVDNMGWDNPPLMGNGY